jgi:hypothetical protein
LYFCCSAKGSETFFHALIVGSGAKIFDLRGFFENTRYCGITCKKIAYMVKFGRKINGMQCPFFSASQQFQGIQ